GRREAGGDPETDAGRGRLLEEVAPSGSASHVKSPLCVRREQGGGYGCDLENSVCERGEECNEEAMNARRRGPGASPLVPRTRREATRPQRLARRRSVVARRVFETGAFSERGWTQRRRRSPQ